jgi:ASC-1-like (ASCH) protein
MNLKDKIFKMHTFNIDKKWLDLIKSGEKKSEIRKYLLPLEGQRVGLVNNDSGNIELIITIGIIIDLQVLEEEDLELIFEEAKIDDEFRKFYPCNYLYTIKKVETVH